MGGPFCTVVVCHLGHKKLQRFPKGGVLVGGLLHSSRSIGEVESCFLSVESFWTTARYGFVLEPRIKGFFWSIKTWKGATYANRKVLWHRDLHGVLWLFVQTFRGTDFGLILLGEDGAHQPMYEEKWAFLLFSAPKSFATRNWFCNFPFGFWYTRAKTSAFCSSSRGKWFDADWRRWWRKLAVCWNPVAWWFYPPAIDASLQRQGG